MIKNNGDKYLYNMETTAGKNVNINKLRKKQNLIFYLLKIY